MLLLLHIIKYIVRKKQQINTSLAQTSDPRGSLVPTAQSANQPYGTEELQGSGGWTPQKFHHLINELFWNLTYIV